MFDVKATDCAGESANCGPPGTPLPDGFPVIESVLLFQVPNSSDTLAVVPYWSVARISKLNESMSSSPGPAAQAPSPGAQRTCAPRAKGKEMFIVSASTTDCATERRMTSSAPVGQRFPKKSGDADSVVLV